MASLLIRAAACWPAASRWTGTRTRRCRCWRPACSTTRRAPYQRAADRGRARDDRPASRPRRRRRGRGHHDAARDVPDLRTDTPDPRWWGGCAGPSCCSAFARAPGARQLAQPGGIFRPGGQSRFTSARWPRWGPLPRTATRRRWPRHPACVPRPIYLEEASVTGTETAMLAAAGAAGTTELRHAACEPHVVETRALPPADGRRRHRGRNVHDQD